MSAEIVPQDQGVLKTFALFVANLEAGQLNADATEALNDIAARLSNYVIEHGGKPSATLTLTVTLKLDGGNFDVKSSLKTKLPEEPRDKTVLWATPANQLTVQNPRQSEMFGPREIRTV